MYDRNFPLLGFSFKRLAHGHYKVTYQSEHDCLCGRIWVRYVSDMPLIDATLHEEHPKRKDVLKLLREVKNGTLVKFGQ